MVQCYQLHVGPIHQWNTVNLTMNLWQATPPGGEGGREGEEGGRGGRERREGEGGGGEGGRAEWDGGWECGSWGM